MLDKRDFGALLGKGGFEIIEAGETFTGEAEGFTPQEDTTISVLHQNSIALGGNYLANTYVLGVYYPAKGYFTTITCDTGSLVVYPKNEP
jgi:hypothetical protein